MATNLQSMLDMLKRLCRSTHNHCHGEVDVETSLMTNFHSRKPDEAPGGSAGALVKYCTPLLYCRLREKDKK